MGRILLYGDGVLFLQNFHQGFVSVVHSDTQDVESGRQAACVDLRNTGLRDAFYQCA